MKSLFFCVLVLLVSTYGEAHPQPDASKYANNPENRYDQVKSAEADSMNAVSHDKNSDSSAETVPHPDSEVESVVIVGNSNNEDYSDDAFEEYDPFFPSLKGNDDLEKFQNYGNQFMTDPFKDQNSFFNMYPNSAYALAATGPDRTHQIAAISPENPAHGLVVSKKDDISSATTKTTAATPVNPWFPSFPFMPNFNNFFNSANNQPNIEMYSDGFGTDAGASSESGKPHFTSVSSFSSSSSVNVNGHNVNHKTAETVVNRDGKVTKYRVQDK